MAFKMKNSIRNDYIAKPSQRRSGEKIAKIIFLVAHDTGNDGTSASQNVTYYKNSANETSASAHLFVDNKEIVQCIPLTEKAWHVRYNVTVDNDMYGASANDSAIGIELCFFSKDKEKSKNAYEKYVWLLAYLCYQYKLNPKKHIVGHETLDANRRNDPSNALSKIGKKFTDLITDVVNEYNDCIDESPIPAQKTMHLEVLVNQLYTYKTPDWNDKTGPIVNKGEVFTITKSLVVAGSKMYQLKSGVYITANSKYVKVTSK